MKKNWLWNIPSAGVLVSLFACSSAPADRLAAADPNVAVAPVASGVQGSVLVSPGCPGPQIAGRSCDRTLPNQTIELVNDLGTVVARSTSATDGGFSMVAPAGHYTLQIVRQGVYPRCPTMPVLISVGAMANLTVICDSGMR